MTWTHGASAYRKGHCRCRAICTPAHTRKRAQERAEGRQFMNSGNSRTLRLVDDMVAVSQRQANIIEAWLRDGADAETVGRRLGLSRVTVHRNLAAVQAACEFDTRLEMAVAFLRGHVTYRVDSEPIDEMSMPARRQEGA